MGHDHLPEIIRAKPAPVLPKATIDDKEEFSALFEQSDDSDDETRYETKSMKLGFRYARFAR